MDTDSVQNSPFLQRLVDPVVLQRLALQRVLDVEVRKARGEVTRQMSCINAGQTYVPAPVVIPTTVLPSPYLVSKQSKANRLDSILAELTHQ